MNGPRGKSPARAGIGRRGRALRSGDGDAVVGRHEKKKAPASGGSEERCRRSPERGGIGLRLRCAAEADNSRSSSLARMCAKTLVCGEKCSSKSSPPMSTGICKSLKKGPKGPFFVPAKNYWKPPRPALPSAEPRTEKTAGLPWAVFSIGGLDHAQAAAGRVTRAESIGPRVPRLTSCSSPWP